MAVDEAMELVRVGGCHEAADDGELVTGDPTRLGQHVADGMPAVLPSRRRLGVVAHRRHGHLEGGVDAGNRDYVS